MSASATKNPKLAAAASFVGSTLEYYDFFIYGSAAALVFGKLFFPSENPALGTLLALATFAIGYLGRPIGAAVIGHYGDRIGRKQMLILTLIGMGVCTFLIGVLPTYEQIGIAAPILLLVLRLMQGARGVRRVGRGPPRCRSSTRRSTGVPSTPAGSTRARPPVPRSRRWCSSGSPRCRPSSSSAGAGASRSCSARSS